MKKQKPNIHDSMWEGAPPESFAKAKQLRMNATKAEIILWDKLRNHQLEEIKFRRQHPIGFYIADFYCHSFKLIIEVDGEYHFTEEQQRKDDERTAYFIANGLNVIRFTNREIQENINKVIEEIKAALLEISN